MTWIRTIPDQEARGRLRSLFAAARKRTGRVYNIVRAMSLNPPTLQASLSLYRGVMFGKSTLSTTQREMLAVVVSVRNRCQY
ncbi:MAG: carboxymuconolactone decarboxylase family protein [Planctomycetota bacterium]|nr:carboxymuconolactone decarboxylase family protein [Planctomycetota bacterium]MCZ6698084.1 carboxymuconolactone decarboxylase family protein [Planctomycetota bacterium]